jgi:1-acyl-sn-glycerol-3-phosphate acyltransferase
MVQRIKSLLIWAGIILLVLFWLPLLALIRLFDRNPVRYRTGRWFRKLGYLISKVNPTWDVDIEGGKDVDDRNPYVMVSNHLSNADIPVISNLPWEMKWIAKKELFGVPIVGWMMKMSGDISVDRSSSNKRIGVFKQCKYYLDRNISVIFFPEGTRSRSGKVNRFAIGAFDLAIREQKPILPIALDGTQDCLPKKSWIFKPNVHVRMKVLDPIPTVGMEKEDAVELVKDVQRKIATQIAEWRAVSVEDVLG